MANMQPRCVNLCFYKGKPRVSGVIIVNRYINMCSFWGNSIYV